MKIKTQGTDVYVQTSDDTFDVLACVMSADGLSGARDQIDVTCFSSKEREYVSGMATPTTITIGGAYDTTDAVFQDLLDLKDSGAIVEFVIAGNDGTEAPTIAGGVVTLPTDRTCISFDGYVADISWTFEANNVWKYSLVVQRSAAWTLSPAVGP